LSANQKTICAVLEHWTLNPENQGSTSSQTCAI